MYHILSIGLDNSSVWDFWKSMFCFRNVGSDPGRLASSMRSWARRSTDNLLFHVAGLTGWVGMNVGAIGWEILFCPTMDVPGSERVLEVACDGKFTWAI